MEYFLIETINYQCPIVIFVLINNYITELYEQTNIQKYKKFDRRAEMPSRT